MAEGAAPSGKEAGEGSAEEVVGADEFLWLEEVEGDKCLEWVRAQNKLSCGEYEQTQRFTELHARILSILDSDERIPHIAKRAQYVYNFWQDKKNERGLWRRTSFDAYRAGGLHGEHAVAWETVLDLDELSARDGVEWVWHGSSFLPHSYERCLVSLSRGGADADVTFEFDAVRKRFVPQEEGGFYVPESKGSASWVDEDTLLVSCSTLGATDSGYPRGVRVWRRGEKLEEAVEVFAGEQSDVSVSGWKSFRRHHEHMMVRRSITFYTSEYHLLTPPADPASRSGFSLARIAVQDDADVSVWRGWLLVELRSDWPLGGRVFAQGSLVAVRLGPFQAGEDVVAGGHVHALFTPTPRTALEGFSATRRSLVLNILDNVRSSVRRVWLDEEEGAGAAAEAAAVRPACEVWRDVPFEGLPEFASISVSPFEALESDELLLTITDFVTPTTLSFVGAEDGAPLEPLKALPSFFDASQLDISQHEATSLDGTRIPYFQVSTRGASGARPTVIEAYGGFEISMTPYYSATKGAAWMERGATYVLANIRGGGEFGPAYHQAAVKEKRHKAYEDLIAVGEHVVERGVASRAQLGVMGGSNGGLLVGNMLTMRPDLWGAVVCQVPLLDMRRFHLLLAGASWMGEYGNPDTDDWSFMQHFSAYHNVKQEVKYPRVLFQTSTRDDRVHPGHARKMVAKMKAQGHDVVYYENIEGGHGGASTNRQRAFMNSLMWCFLWGELDPSASL